MNNEIIEQLNSRLKENSEYGVGLNGVVSKYGISHSLLDDWLGRKSTVGDLKNLDLTTAVKIYYTNYFFKPRLNILPTELQSIVFDLVFVHGSKTGISIFQLTLKELGEHDVVADGWIGLQSGEACERVIRQHGISKVINTIIETRNKFIDQITKLDPSKKQFANGWKAHSNSFRRK